MPLRGKAVFRQFSETELEFIKEFKAGELSVEAGTTVLLEGTNSAHLYTVLSGWAFGTKCCLMAVGRFSTLPCRAILLACKDPCLIRWSTRSSTERFNSVHLSARESLDTLL